MTACNITVCKSGSASVVIKFTTATATPTATPVPGTPTPVPPTPAVGPPPTVHVECTWSHGGPGAQIDCFTQFSEAYNSITWTATNATPATLSTGAKHFQTFRDGAGDATVRATVCLGSVCTVSDIATAPAGAVPPPPPSPMAMALSSSICGGSFNEFEMIIFVYLDSWTPDDPYPTGIVNFFIDGNSIGAAPVDSGEPIAHTSAPMPNGTAIPFTANYTGDSNWSSSTLNCFFDNFGP
jgi:hypothetical protein